MIHILFDQSSAGSLRIAFREKGIDKKEQIISFWDMFSIGPFRGLHEEAGQESRFDWMKDVKNDEFGEFLEYIQSFQKTIDRILSIPEELLIFIWTADNAHEQTGLRFVLQLLKGKNNDVTVINTTKSYSELFKTGRRRQYTVLHSGEINPDKLQIIYDQGEGRVLTDHDREDYENEWISLSENQETLRIWRNGRIVSVPEDYYDPFIIQRAKKLHRKQETKDFMKSARLIGEVLGHLDQYVGDEFLEYRLRKLIEKGVFDVEGSLIAMRYYSVKLR
ncbi:DUF1835 domain-containing protein [Neobacillus vireti]|uniref:DUF1835 domain-containing protein n=1 Tax=Neobacillus vireti LMG 21834 TaxID=1131730 RepID=A0AB94ISA9_9BACI|nr:DUF1835 domain-containing protein [Neobacillus vireti]ETI69990.1 hypothetical protein BAVI_04814 [Neobacillus vireti LMG 21834]KLT15157.1 hypothetical protein AA980_25110 [Neobacillus vireti]